MRYQNHILMYGFGEDEVRLLESVKPSRDTVVRNVEDFTDLIAIGAFALIINWERVNADQQKLLFDFYTEVEVSTEVVILIGTPNLPEHLTKRFLCYDSFDDVIINIKYTLLTAYRKTQKVENFSATLANAILILSQIRSHPGISSKELAEQLELSPRSVQRYVETLRITSYTTY